MVVVLGISSCRKVLDVDIEEKDKKIVANSLFNTDSVIRVHLSKSKGILEDDYNIELIQNAQIDLFEDNQLIESLTNHGSGIYKSNIIPQQNKTYKIWINVPDMQSAYADAYLPTAPEILQLDTLTKTIHYSDQFNAGYDVEAFTASMKFKDPPGKNYYMVTTRIINTYTDNYGTYRYDYYTMVNTDDPALADQSYQMNMSDLSALVFSDELFDNSTYDLALYIERYNLSMGHNTVIFSLSNISEEMFYYTVSYFMENNSDGPFSEPVIVYNNINGGFGIFAGYSADTTSVSFEITYNDDDWIP